MFWARLRFAQRTMKTRVGIRYNNVLWTNIVAIPGHAIRFSLVSLVRITYTM